ncbi:MAG: hypothetical protein AAFO82_00460 [Bacteroidota bacterium]
MSTSALEYQPENEEQVTVTISKREHQLLKNLQALLNDKRFMQKFELLLQILTK